MSKTIENTLENKAKFFAIYLGQRVMRCKTFNVTTGHGLSGLMNVDVNSETIKENWFLELKPLSSISKEDANEIFKMAIPYTGRYEITTIFNSSAIVDFLRSRGYALPWMGLSVDQLIEYGWVKLKED